MFQTTDLHVQAAERLHNFSLPLVPSETARAGTVRLCFVGDLMLGRRVSATVGWKQAREFWGDTLDILTGAHAVIGNLESPVTDHQGRWSEGWKAFRFAALPKVVDLLNLANVRAVSLANNHALDCEAQGLADTLLHLGRADIAYAGAGLSLSEAWRPALFRAGPMTVGLIGVTDNMKEFAAEADKPGTSYCKINTEPGTLALIDRLVRDLRAAGAETVILSTHWGPNLRTAPPDRFRRFARAVIGLGVDVVHGHSAHLVQGVEVFGNGLILYDTGDFLDDYWVFPGIRIDHSFAFVVEYRDCRAVRLDMFPVKLTPGQVSLARGEDFRDITEAMHQKSSRLGTSLRDIGGGLTVEIGNSFKAVTGCRIAPRGAHFGQNLNECSFM